MEGPGGWGAGVYRGDPGRDQAPSEHRDEGPDPHVGSTEQPHRCPLRGEAQRELVSSSEAHGHLGAGPAPVGREPGVSVLSPCPPGVFPPPAPAAANEPVLEEGMVAPVPLADTLDSPQPSPAAGPVVSARMGPLNTLLPGLGPISQSSPLSSLLTGPLSDHLASPVAVPLADTPASSLSLPSTGPLTPSSPLTGSRAVPQSSPLMDVVTGSVALSLSSPLLTSTAAPLGVSQNLPANPVSSLVLLEAPRVWLAEPLQGCPSGPHPSAGGGPAATAEGNRCRGRGSGGPGGGAPARLVGPGPASL